jgi:signal transduction histidine kinase
MSRFRDQLIPLLAGLLVVAVAISVVLLLRSANDQGIHALTNAKRDQVQTTANSFNARINVQLGSAAGLGKVPWQLTPGSAADQKVLNSYNVDPNVQSGFFLINSQDMVTTGVLLRPGAAGSKFDPPGWARAKSQLENPEMTSIVLPVSRSGLTTELPVYDFVVGIRDSSGHLRGALVAEQAVTNSSPFQQEIFQLGLKAPSTAAWFFVDGRGSVVATSRPARLGQHIDPQYLKVSSGPAHIGKLIVFSAPVPSLHWHVVFLEERSQFESGVTGPLQQAGLILVLLLLAVGLTLVVILVRRLRAAREQERRLRELTRSQSEFISVVSHELRTPVAGVLGFLQTTVDHWATLTDAERLATVRRAVANARRLQAMTRDVLDTESIESGRIGYSFQPTDLAAELEMAVEGSRIADHSRLIILDEPATPITVEADPDRMQQVLSNLLENARKNSPPSEPITVTAEIVEDDSGGRKARVSVIDRGPGVSPDSIERIFEKFVRGNDDAVTGTGLGLYIVRTIVEAHHGRIWCESDPGRRTAFVFELPLVDVPVSSAT